MKKILTSVLLLLVFTGFQASQTDLLQGTVVSSVQLTPLKGVHVLIKNKNIGTSTDSKGRYVIPRPSKGDTITFSLPGYKARQISYSGEKKLNIQLQKTTAVSGKYKQEFLPRTAALAIRGMGTVVIQQAPPQTETYASFGENKFVNPQLNPLSTFGTDVDAAAYSNVRRFINQGQLPPAEAVRVEEMINYFQYNYPAPEVGEPLSISTELSTAPWNSKHKLLRIGLQAKKIELQKIPASNLVLLIDVSGSMNTHNKLPLVKSSLRMLVNQLRPSDKVSIVSYAGSARVVLESTSGKDKKKILDAIDELRAGGSTAGEAGINLAYELAASNFIKNGNNRVIMASDGDFNTGQSSDIAMQKLIEEKRRSGIFLSVLGLGMGNYKDSKMELLADKGNGNYAYIDNISEGRKVLVTQLGSTLFTVAKDVKLQVEFNPARVQAYRLIGYENRSLSAEDFKNDQKDAGDLGAGHAVTAFYEIIPPGVKSSFTGTVDQLKYRSQTSAADATHTDELANIKIRYKEPKQETSRQIARSVSDASVPLERSSSDFRFAAAVAGYGMLLKKSEFVRGYTAGMAAQLAGSALNNDNEGFRSEFVRLAKASSLLAEDLLTVTEN